MSLQETFDMKKINAIVAKYIPDDDYEITPLKKPTVMKKKELEAQASQLVLMKKKEREILNFKSKEDLTLQPSSLNQMKRKAGYCHSRTKGHSSYKKFEDEDDEDIQE